MTAATRDVTQLLASYAHGNRDALSKLFPVVYQELRQIASAQMSRERSGHTLQPTALVHEAFVRLIDQRSLQWESRTQFFGLAAHIMRRVLVDHARARGCAKRGGQFTKVNLDDVPEPGIEPDADVVALDEALVVLAEMNKRQAEIVELRYFGGLSIEETANVLGISTGTVKRDWIVARAWLLRQLRQPAQEN